MLRIKRALDVKFQSELKPFLFIVVFVFSLTGINFIFATCTSPYNPPVPPVPAQPGPNCEKCEKNCKGSPCYPFTGNYSFSVLDLQLPTRGFPISVTRVYDSVRPVDGPFGIGWGSNLTARLYYANYLYSLPSGYSKEAAISMPNGRMYRFTERPDGVNYDSPVGSHDTLVKNPDGSFTLTLELSRTRYFFSPSGFMTSMSDDYGNTLSYTYNGSNQLSQISDSSGSGRYIDIVYVNGHIDSIEDSSGRIVRYSYYNDGSFRDGAMQTMTDAAGRQTNYYYVSTRFTAPLLSEIRDHWGRTVTSVTYYPYIYGYGQTNAIYSYNRLKSYTEAGETWTYTYNLAHRRQRRILPTMFTLTTSHPKD